MGTHKQLPLRVGQLYDNGLMTENSLFKKLKFSTGINFFEQSEFGTFFGTFSID